MLNVTILTPFKTLRIGEKFYRHIYKFNFKASAGLIALTVIPAQAGIQSYL